MRKRILILLFVLVFALTGTSTALATSASTANGWVQAQDGQWLYAQNGRYVTGWKNIDGYWYYFDYNTCCVYVGLLSYNGTMYYLSPLNGRLYSGWLQYNGSWHYFLPTYYYMARSMIVFAWFDETEQVPYYYYFDALGRLVACKSIW